MDPFTSAWPLMDPSAVPLPTNGSAARRVNPPGLYAPVVPTNVGMQPAPTATNVGMQPAPTATNVGMQPAPTATTEAARHQQQAAEEDAAIRVAHLLVTCASAIQSGDHRTAHGKLAEAHSLLGTAVRTGTGFGRVVDHFAKALSKRLLPTANQHPHADAALPPYSATPVELHHHFYEAGPYIKLAYKAANLAILDATDGCNEVHVVDFGIMQGLQWAELIHGLATRRGGPPRKFRLTGIGPRQNGPRDELREVGARLAAFAGSLNVPFQYRGVCTDRLDELTPWMLGIDPEETVVVNSVLQLHRLLVDPDADPLIPAPIDTVLEWVTGALRPRVFTVVEQEAEHNIPSLLQRFSNALFHYGSLFDSLENVAAARRNNNVGRRGGSGRYNNNNNGLADAYLRAEIFDVVCGEGSARVERHEPLHRWRERLAMAGLIQVPFGPGALHEARVHLFRLTSGPSGFIVTECDGGLAIGWHGRALYSVTAWRAMTGESSAAVASAVVGYTQLAGHCYGSGGESSSNPATTAVFQDPTAIMPF